MWGGWGHMCMSVFERVWRCAERNLIFHNGAETRLRFKSNAYCLNPKA